MNGRGVGQRVPGLDEDLGAATDLIVAVAATAEPDADGAGEVVLDDGASDDVGRRLAVEVRNETMGRRGGGGGGG